MTRLSPVAAGLLLLAGAGIGGCVGEQSSAASLAVATGAAEGRLASADGARGAMVRIINALPGADGVELGVDDNAIFSGVDYKSATPYTALDAGATRFRLRGSDRDTTLTANEPIASDGGRYTIVALPSEDGGTRLHVLHDSLVPSPGKVRVRVVHAIRGAGDIVVTLDGRDEPLFDAVGFGTDASFREVDPAKGILLVRSGGRLLLRKEVKLVADHAYTVVVAGNGARRVDAIILDDQAVAR